MKHFGTHGILPAVVISLVYLSAGGLADAAASVAADAAVPVQLRVGSGGGVAVVFVSTPGVAYQVQRKSNLREAAWEVAADNIVAQDAVTEWNASNTSGGQLFFRVVVQPAASSNKTSTGSKAVSAAAAVAGASAQASLQRSSGGGSAPAVAPQPVTWFVDVAHGSQSFDGRAAAYAGGSGPFASIQQALQQAAPGDRVEVAAGTYPEEVHLENLQLEVRFNGEVILR